MLSMMMVLSAFLICQVRIDLLNGLNCHSFVDLHGQQINRISADRKKPDFAIMIFG